MNTMDNAKVIQTIEKYAFQNYLEKLADAKIHRVTLFTIFRQTGAPNLSDPAIFLLVDDLAKITAMNSGQWLN
ncbi:MAG: hypothetical protein PHH60_01725 [Candidatus Margulisbacteria bacterium]|nr:hypothetical protein [Candidatus Margulisiibacteriota bacterium]